VRSAHDANGMRQGDDAQEIRRPVEKVSTRLAQLVLSASFFVITRVRYDVHITGLDRYRPATSELFISSHRRDLDPLLFATLLMKWFSRAFDRRPIVNVMREDGMRAGFLSTVVGYKEWPVWIQRALYGVNVGPILRLFGAHPVVRVQEYTLEDMFRDLLEDGENPRLDTLLDEAALAEFTARGQRPATELTVREALAWRYRPILRQSIRNVALRKEQRAALNRRLRERVFRQLDTLTGFLRGGATMWFSPEGEVSLDGRIYPIREGLSTIVRQLPPNVTYYPVHQVYEFMTAGRPAIFMVIGQPLPNLATLKRRELAQIVHRALASLVTVTVQHLGSRALLAAAEADEAVLYLDAWVDQMHAEAERFQHLGAYVDPRLFDRAALRQRLRDYLRYCQKHGWVQQEDARRYRLDSMRIRSNTATTFWQNPLRYCANELADLEQALTSALAPLEEAP